MRLLMTLLLLGSLLAACSLTDDDTEDTDEGPSVRTVTSTPTPNESQQLAPTATENESQNEAPTATPSPTITDSVPTPTEEPSPTEPQDESTDEIEAEIEEIESAIIDIRGLDPKTDIAVEIIDRDELQTRIEDLVAEEYTPEQAELDTLTYWLLRLIDDRDLDLYQLQIDLLGEQVAGYYDPETDELVVVTREGRLTAIDKVTTAHEIVHALQDQHFDLLALDELATNSDVETAMTSLVEGDATVAMTLYMFEALDPMELAEVFAESLFQSEDFDVLENAPRYISEGLLFPYNEGQAFVDQIFTQGDFEAINAAFENPPQSTEQILHPEKYLDPSPDNPIEVTLADHTDALGDGWELVSGDALGEWDLRIMLDENGAQDPITAAEGWGGSWFDVYQSTDAAAVVLGTVWDSERDADEFESAVEETFGTLEESGPLFTDGDRFLALERVDGMIYIVSGTDAEAVTAILNDL